MVVICPLVTTIPSSVVLVLGHQVIPHMEQASSWECPLGRIEQKEELLISEDKNFISSCSIEEDGFLRPWSCL